MPYAPCLWHQPLQRELAYIIAPIEFDLCFNSLTIQIINIEDNKVHVWRNEQREFTTDGKTISKRQLRPVEPEFPPHRLRYCVERIKNISLVYLTENTTRQWRLIHAYPRVR